MIFRDHLQLLPWADHEIISSSLMIIYVISGFISCIISLRYMKYIKNLLLWFKLLFFVLSKSFILIMFKSIKKLNLFIPLLKMALLFSVLMLKHPNKIDVQNASTDYLGSYACLASFYFLFIMFLREAALTAIYTTSEVP